MLPKKILVQTEKLLRRAGRKDAPEDYLKKALRYSLMLGLLIAGFAFLIIMNGIGSRGWSPLSFIALPVTFILFTFMFLGLHVQMLSVRAINRRFEIESDMLYSARHLLLKIESGSPLLNSIIDTSNLKTKSSKFYKEIVTDIYLGTPIEQAIEIGIDHCPSKPMVKLLEEIKNSLKTGTDLEKSLKSSLDTLTKEHMITIKSYGKKLSPLSMMYMIFGTILPSLSSALLVLAIGFIDLPLKTTSAILIFLTVSLLVIQFFFILLFKALKPEVMT